MEQFVPVNNLTKQSFQELCPLLQIVLVNEIVEIEFPKFVLKFFEELRNQPLIWVEIHELEVEFSYFVEFLFYHSDLAILFDFQCIFRKFGARFALFQKRMRYAYFYLLLLLLL